MIGALVRATTAPQRAALGLVLDVTLGEAEEHTHVSTAPAGPPPGCEDRWDYANGTWKGWR